MGELSPSPPRSDLREALMVTVWFLLFLAAGDFAVNQLFRQPRDPRVKSQNQLQEYFNYGWSVEAKIRRGVAPTDEAGAPLMLAGWIDREVGREQPGPDVQKDEMLVSFYGMSFSNDVARALAEVEPKVKLRLFGGPGAPPNHSYAMYSRDRGGRSSIVVLAVLGSSVTGLATNNGMTSHFEMPAPFTYPRYFADAAGLKAEWPMIRKLDDLRERLADPKGWEAYLSQLQATDEFYYDFLFRHNLSDYSALMRMVRRAVAQRWQSSQTRKIHGPSGFVEENPVVASLRGIVVDFAVNARRDGKLPIVLLIQDQGYRDHVYQVLEPVLSRDQIPYFSTHTVCPDTDRRNFRPDGHFTKEANRRLGEGLLDVIRRRQSLDQSRGSVQEVRNDRSPSQR